MPNTTWPSQVRPLLFAGSGERLSALGFGGPLQEIISTVDIKRSSVQEVFAGPPSSSEARPPKPESGLAPFPWVSGTWVGLSGLSLSALITRWVIITTGGKRFCGGEVARVKRGGSLPAKGTPWKKKRLINLALCRVSARVGVLSLFGSVQVDCVLDRA